MNLTVRIPPSERPPWAQNKGPSHPRPRRPEDIRALLQAHLALSQKNITVWSWIAALKWCLGEDNNDGGARP